MKVFNPLRENVVVEIIKDQIKTGIVLPGSDAGRWVRLKILAVGPTVTEKIKPGQIVLAENMVEQIDVLHHEIGVILSKYIHVVEETKEKYES